LQRIRREATRSVGDGVFIRLKDLRRQVADARALLGEAKRLCIEPMLDVSQWCVNREDLKPDQFWSQKPSATTSKVSGRARAMDIRDLPDSLDRFGQMIDDMQPIINGEIQMLIMSLQVEDGKLMKRQAKWTVVLAILATIYLPLTLVTGIFGMNIREINDEGTRPDRWSAVKAWGIALGATIGLIWALIAVRRLYKWLLRARERLVQRRKIPDVEAMKIE